MDRGVLVTVLLGLVVSLCSQSDAFVVWYKHPFSRHVTEKAPRNLMKWKSTFKDDAYFKDDGYFFGWGGKRRLAEGLPG
ncbi:hypothetical protein DPMN_173903 [Dreissena polymorpha]|uniref:Uncharacterized protein n=1 Tax=Dreissena polymorpha TaxID=45954 RepID=A0A9D4E6F6_DREPO|nr:hypothetical protein DPMN_173903 [Dreissena polymorpha]